ncbi:cation:proton antiporter [Streptomyces triculaminicus]|uniref:Cation:proton antiporter n=1 Tax=Streptomyces triculaminicus TaxID=2816232 RepID=A0A939FNK1_9ACTN|nr:cation:proton antiporter [Streptomyces triculaminicus]MBO0653989.1 cation:proton antiporter [Streptomyces triculaminicus]
MSGGLLAEAGTLLGAALVLGRLAVRVGMPPVVGELCAGILLGPSVLGHIVPSLSSWLPDAAAPQGPLNPLGLLGVVLLVGMTGIEIDIKALRRRRVATLAVGTTGLLVPLGLGVAAGFMLPSSLVAAGSRQPVFAAFLGVALCVSAIPVIAKILADMRLLHRTMGQLILGAGMVDDAIGWLLLSVVSAMATSRPQAGHVLMSVGAMAAVVILALAVARPLVRRALDLAGRSQEAAPTIAVATVILMLGAAATQALGLEPMLGAFIGGVLIGSGSNVDLRRLAPLRAVVMAVFAPLFFATAGLHIDLAALAHPIVASAALVVLAVAVVGKFAGAFLGALVARLGVWEALAMGAGMNARGVIQIVVATAGLRLGVLTPATYTIIVLVAVVTSVMAPPVLRVAMRRIEQTEEEELRRRDLAAFSEPSLEGRPEPRQ